MTTQHLLDSKDHANGSIASQVAKMVRLVSTSTSTSRGLIVMVGRIIISVISLDARIFTIFLEPRKFRRMFNCLLN